MAAREMTYIDHISELRRRVLWLVATIIIAVAVAFSYSAQILEFITSPVDTQLIVQKPSEAFYVHLQVSLAVAIAVNIPVALYHIIAFIFPGLTRSEKKWVLACLPPVLILFLGGMAFAWLVVVPVIYSFFMQFTSEALQPLISVGAYISFVTGIVIPFGVVFELPVFIALLTGIGLLTPMFLSRYRKFAILIIFILAAFLTPPDPISQTMLALPLLALYEISLWVARIVFNRKQLAAARRQAELQEFLADDDGVSKGG